MITFRCEIFSLLYFRYTTARLQKSTIFNQNSSRIANLLTGTKYSTQTANYPPTNITAKDNNSPKAGLLVEIVY